MMASADILIIILKFYPFNYIRILFALSLKIIKYFWAMIIALKTLSSKETFAIFVIINKIITFITKVEFFFLLDTEKLFLVFYLYLPPLQLTNILFLILNLGHLTLSL